MSTTDDVLKKARELGDLISEHPATKKLEDVLQRLQNDTDAQRALNDYNRHLQALAEKEQAGRPIEVEDKRKLEQLQGALVRNPILRDFQMAQMDYLDLMRQVDEATQGSAAGAAPGAPGTAPGPAPSPIVSPEFSPYT